MYNYKEMSRIKFQRQQGNIKGKSSLELLNEFFMFLQGECPDAISVREMPKLNSQQAFSVIYYLQEHLPVGIKEQMNTITNRYNKWLYLFHISSC